MMLQYFKDLESGIASKIKENPDSPNARKKYALEVARLGTRLYSGHPRQPHTCWPGPNQARDVLPQGLRWARGRYGGGPGVSRPAAPVRAPGGCRGAGEGPGGHPHLHQLETVHNFAGLIGKEHFQELAARSTVASIGPITTATLLEYGITPRVEPAAFTIPALAAAIVDYFKKGELKGRTGGRVPRPPLKLPSQPPVRGGGGGRGHLRKSPWPPPPISIDTMTYTFKPIPPEPRCAGLITTRSSIRLSMRR